MSGPPESFMIFKEELRKAQLEKARIEKEYQEKFKQFSGEMDILKEKLAAQEEMMRSALDYAMKLEDELRQFKLKVKSDNEKNSYGYH